MPGFKRQNMQNLGFKLAKNMKNKIGVINDPLSQPTDPTGSDCSLILKLWDGRMDNLCEK